MNGLRLPCTPLLRTGVWFLVALAGAVESGCQSSKEASLDSAIRAYDTGSYQRAFDDARSSRLSSSGRKRAESAYVAGLAAMMIDRPVTARNFLEEAARSGDRVISGRANASLGTLLLEDHEPLAAARAFDQAAASLTGSDRTRARRQAGLAYEKAGMNTLARQRLSEAGPMTSSLPGRFTIQAGFFKDRTSAVRRAEELSGLGLRLNLGSAMVVPTTARGTRGYAVQVGDFSNRAEAETARRSLGDTRTFVTKVAQP
ncbi:MAG: SPOR domain-containing protein [Planctomycetota bacterium]|nr:SPOR domain-containing protein [Planctomycetota bacterium]